jgi:hypothetical protein
VLVLAAPAVPGADRLARRYLSNIICAAWTASEDMDGADADGESSDAGSQIECDELEACTDFEYVSPPAAPVNDFRSEDVDHLIGAPYPALRKLLGLQPNHATLLNMVRALYKEPRNRNVRFDGKVFEYYSCGAWRRRQSSRGGLDVLTNALFRFMDIEHVLEAGMRALAYDELTLFREDMDEKFDARYEDADQPTRMLVAKVLQLLATLSA